MPSILLELLDTTSRSGTREPSCQQSVRHKGGQFQQDGRRLFHTGTIQSWLTSMRWQRLLVWMHHSQMQSHCHRTMEKGSFQSTLLLSNHTGRSTHQLIVACVTCAQVQLQLHSHSLNLSHSLDHNHSKLHNNWHSKQTLT